jgi:hypothetical protein
MNETINKPDFETLEFNGDLAIIKGKVWERGYTWDRHLRRLTRNVPAGVAELQECQSTAGNFMLKIAVMPSVARAEIEKCQYFDTVEAAAEAAEAFAWEIKVHGGFKWYQTACRADYKAWTAVLGKGDKAILSCNSGGEYHMKRDLSIQYGMSYEFTATRYDSGDSKLAVRSFAEAVAIAITLPTFMSALSAK